MLSYRHAFHAGNHADVLKHLVLDQLLIYLNQKDKPYWYIDTHAGAGVYALTEGYATKNAEFATGVARLWQRNALPEPVASYLQHVLALNPDGALRYYPGSPQLAAQRVRPDDRLRLYELHSSDFTLLQENMSPLGKRVLVEKSDGFAGLKALLPPPPRRALVLIDPPYEDKKDYSRVTKALEDALRRFATGIYAVWYPQLQRVEWQLMLEQLKRLPVKGWLNVSLQVEPPHPDGFGMYGSGMFILNPPYTLYPLLEQLMPWLVQTLGQGAGSRFVLEQQAA